MKDRLTLIDRYRLFTRERDIDSTLRVSHTIVKEHLDRISALLESDIDALIDMPESSRYKLSLSSKRLEQGTLEFKWKITITLEDKTSKGRKPLFDDTPREYHSSSFHIWVSANRIDCETGFSGKKEAGEYIFKGEVKDVKPPLNAEMSAARDRSIRRIRKHFLNWIATHCVDHAGLYFLDRPDDLRLVLNHREELRKGPRFKQSLETAKDSPTKKRDERQSSYKAYEFKPFI